MADLGAIVDKLEARHIVPILSTIPPRTDVNANQLTIQFNAAVTSFARARHLPLIAFYEEILLRRPGNSWMRTLSPTECILRRLVRGTRLIAIRTCLAEIPPRTRPATLRSMSAPCSAAG